MSLTRMASSPVPLSLHNQYKHRVCLSLKLMQAEVEQLQEKVNGLHSMVVVVDENNAESGMPIQHRYHSLGTQFSTHPKIILRSF